MAFLNLGNQNLTKIINPMPKGIPTTGTRKPGAGRKTGPQTITVSFRVPISHAARIKLLVKSFLLELKNEPS
jgi:hypothetical protein